MVPLSELVSSTTARALDTAKAKLSATENWPDPTTGFAYYLLDQTHSAKPDFMSLPLRHTTPSQLRLTPELAGYGYTMHKAEAETIQMWCEGIERLRGREIYPPDRQSFIFNPTEILGIAVGLMACPAVTLSQREWFAETILKGLKANKFSTPISKGSAFTALAYVDPDKAELNDEETIEVAELTLSDLLLVAGIRLAFARAPFPEVQILQQEWLSRLLKEEIPINSAIEAAATVVLANRVVDQIAIMDRADNSIDLILSLCRRFPLFVERIQDRQRNRAPYEIADEYDVQDLLHGILKLHFDDVRPEEWTPSYAGSASRVDFFLPRERIVVETKMTRANLDQKRVTDELIIDAQRYSKMNRVETLICMVYDPNRHCKNPKTLENDVEESNVRLDVKAVVCPQGF